jgi:hypothetical protein
MEECMTEPKIVLNGARLGQIVVRAPGTADLALAHARVYVTTPTGDAEWVFDASLRFTGVTRIDARSAGDGALLGEDDVLRDAALIMAAEESGASGASGATVEGDAAPIVESDVELRIVRADLGLAPSGASLSIHASSATVTLGRGHRVSEAPSSAAPDGQT